jgi:hypothetical protein
VTITSNYNKTTTNTFNKTRRQAWKEAVIRLQITASWRLVLLFVAEGANPEGEDQGPTGPLAMRELQKLPTAPKVDCLGAVKAWWSPDGTIGRIPE